VTFQAGRVSAVYGLRLVDGRELVAKVHRRPVNVARLAAAVAVLESLLDAGTPGNAHEPDTRRAMARSLAEQVDLLRLHSARVPAAERPAWATYEVGPWPVPHDPVSTSASLPRATSGLIASLRMPVTRSSRARRPT
jgi:hypothetical protein